MSRKDWPTHKTGKRKTGPHATQVNVMKRWPTHKTGKRNQETKQNCITLENCTVLILSETCDCEIIIFTASEKQCKTATFHSRWTVRITADKWFSAVVSLKGDKHCINSSLLNHTIIDRQTDKVQKHNYTLTAHRLKTRHFVITVCNN